MATKITMPPGGQTTNESLIVKWNKVVGDAVKKGDILFEIETDKAVMEIESFVDGTLLGVKYSEGEYASTGEVVAYIGDEGEKLPDEFKEPTVNQNNTEDISKYIAKEEDEYQPIIKTDTNIQTEFIKSEDSKSIKVGKVNDTFKTLASPAARFLAKQEKMDISELSKNFPGQILKRGDVENHIKKIELKDEGEYYFINTTAMRKTIARRMCESVAVAPCFNVTVEIDMTQAIELRQEFNSYLNSQGIKVSFNDIIMKCVSKAIEKHAIINSTYGEDKIKVYNNVNFGLAVGLENGLMVPVVSQVNKKSIADIAKENSENINKAKNGKLQTAQMSGGTITLSSLGMYGVDCFTAIINQPESCILAVGGIIEKPVVINGSIVPRPMMSITATYDHRVIDGAAGAGFLKDVKALLEKPQLLLL